MKSADTEFVNIFAKGSDVQVGTLSVNDYNKIISNVSSDFELHISQLVNASVVVFNSYFILIKVYFFIIGIVTGVMFLFSDIGFGQFTKELYHYMVNEFSGEEALKLREAYWSVTIDVFRLLSETFLYSVAFGVISFLTTYFNLLKKKVKLLSVIEGMLISPIYAFCGFFDRIFPVKESNLQKMRERKYVPIKSIFGYRNIFDEHIGITIKSKLQEVTDSDIYVKINDRH